MSDNFLEETQLAHQVVQKIAADFNQAAERPLHTGTVKWFNRRKGHGFIIVDGQEREAFVHYSAIVGSGYRNLYEGDRVSFTLHDFGKGPQARAVRRMR
jgi:CspA family cold shock protein